MPVTTYTTIDGEIVSQDVNGTVHDLLPDPLGHTVGLIGSGQGIEFEYTYWPYEEVGSIDDVATALRYVGTLGYYSDDYGSPRVYVRARHYRGPYGRWLTVDPLWPHEPPYCYATLNPTSVIDPSGNHPCDTRTADYCARASSTGSSADACICRVSAEICALIKNTSITRCVREWLDCVNRGMHKCFTAGTSPACRYRDAVCGSFGSTSLECCKATIGCEQSCFTAVTRGYCSRVGCPPPSRPWGGWIYMWPVSFLIQPEPDRILAARKACCDPCEGS